MNKPRLFGTEGPIAAVETICGPFVGKKPSGCVEDLNDLLDEYKKLLVASRADRADLIEVLARLYDRACDSSAEAFLSYAQDELGDALRRHHGFPTNKQISDGNIRQLQSMSGCDRD